MPREKAKSNRATPAATLPERRETWKVCVYYLFVSHDLSERREIHVLGADTRLAALNAADMVREKGLMLTRSGLIDIILPSRILQVSIFQEIV